LIKFINMKNYLTLILCIVSFTISKAQTSNLLFKSSFNYNVIVDKTVVWNHHLNGTDSITNYTFPDDLPGDNIEHFFNYVVGDMANYSDYANAEIVNTMGANGDSTTALFIEFIKDDTNFVSYSRVQYAMYGDSLSNDPVERMNQGYVKYKIKTHFDHNDTLSDWRIPVEWKDADDDGFRMGLYMYDSNTPNPYWVVKGQYMISGGLGNDVWQYDNYSIPVIEDQWFDLEMYWLADPDSTVGKLKIAINGQVLFDVTHQTKDPNQPNKIFYFMPFKVYGTVGHSWITDFEYWNIPPLTSVLSDNHLNIETKKQEFNDKVYPIPTHNYLYFTTKNTNLNYQITTVTGKVIQKGFLENNPINISDLKGGIYFITYCDNTNKIRQTLKFIKE